MSVKEKIKDHVKNINKSNVYVGIASDLKQRLFEDHNVDEKNGHYIGLNAETSAKAREIEKALLAEGFKGGPGGGDYSTKYVYAYRITTSTVQ
jgi:hypothetical protein